MVPRLYRGQRANNGVGRHHRMACYRMVPRLYRGQRANNGMGRHHRMACYRMVPRLYRGQRAKQWHGTSPLTTRMRCRTYSQHPSRQAVQLNKQLGRRPSNVTSWMPYTSIPSPLQVPDTGDPISGINRRDWPTIRTRNVWAEGDEAPLLDDLRSHPKRKRTSLHQHSWHLQHLISCHSYYNCCIIQQFLSL